MERLSSSLQASASNANAALAYKFWLARLFRDGTPEEDLFRAVCANSVKSETIKGKRQPAKGRANHSLQLPERWSEVKARHGIRD